MLPTVLATLRPPEPWTALLGERARLRVLERIPAPEELRAAVAGGADVLCPQLRDRVDLALLEGGGPRLRAVCTYSAGVDNVDVDAATRLGVVVANTPGVLTGATADCALGLMLAAARRLCEGDRELRAGRFTGWEPTYLLGLDLDGSLLGIVGFGRIGQAVARRALALGMRIAVASRPGHPPPAAAGIPVEAMPLDRLLASADVVSLHCPLTAETRHLMDEAALRLMKPTAILVNTARGAVVDERALVRALREGWIAGAGLDVYEEEPRTAPGLSECPTAVLAPHLGSATVRTRSRMAELCARNVLAALDGELPGHSLNPGAWDGRRPGRSPGSA